MMALGIPGDGITAMLIAGLTIHGLQAGPLFMTEQPDLAMLIFACVMVAAIVTYHRTDYWKTLVPLYTEGSLPLPVHGDSGHLLHRRIRDFQYHV